jgi:PBSX family phage portal protein
MANGKVTVLKKKKKKTKKNTNEKIPFSKAMENSNEINEKVLRQVRAIIVDVNKQQDGVKPGKSQKMEEDPVQRLGREGKIIVPPFDMLVLATLAEHNTEMHQCVEAMEINVESFGHRFVPRIKTKPGEKLDPKLEAEINKEKVFLTNFFKHSTRESYVRFRRKLRKDYELTGNRYYEVIRDSKRKIQSFTHLPSYQMSLGAVEEKMRKIKRPVLMIQEDGTAKIDHIIEWRRFRTFVQARSVQLRNVEMLTGTKVRWFKEFGDDRVYNNETGQLAKKNLAIDKQATEVIHKDMYSARSPYGLPRYIGNLLSIFGDRAAEEINYVTFKNNNIPSMIIGIANGQLTDGSLERIKEFAESNIQGDNYSKFLLIEAEGDFEGEDGNQVKMTIQPLTKEQHDDALFQKYSESNQDKVRRAWRLPPIIVGRTDDYSRSTSDNSRQIADEQIFAPERDEYDDEVNDVLFPEMGIVHHEYRSNSPNTTDNQQLVAILAGAEKTGGMTPRIARSLLEGILGRDLPEFPDDFEVDKPFSLLMAEAVKNKAEVAEPGQQVTAIKALFGEDSEWTGSPLIDHLIAVNQYYEKNWAKGLEE